MKRGFTLGEVLVSMALMGLALLTLLSVASTALRADRKSVMNLTAVGVAEREMNRAVTMALNDKPAGEKDNFWNGNFAYPGSPYKTGSAQVGKDKFDYAIYAVDVTDTAGTDIGDGAADNKVKRVDIVVWWWDGTGQGQRQGYGKTQCSAFRLVNQGETQ